VQHTHLNEWSAAYTSHQMKCSIHILMHSSAKNMSMPHRAVKNNTQSTSLGVYDAQPIFVQKMEITLQKFS